MSLTKIKMHIKSDILNMVGFFFQVVPFSYVLKLSKTNKSPFLSPSLQALK